VGLTQHAVNDEAVSHSDGDSQKTGNVDAVPGSSELKSVEDVVNDGPLLSGSVADSAARQNVTESSCSMLSSSAVLCYASVDESTNLEEHIVDFLLSLFWVLESKRLDRSCEHVDNLTLLTAPFEQRKDSSTADIDSRWLTFHILHMMYMMLILTTPCSFIPLFGIHTLSTHL